MFKKLLAVILALVCCVSLLAGCGGSGDEQTNPPVNKDLLNYETPDLNGIKLTQYSSDNADFDPEGSWVDGAIEEKLGISVEYIELSSWTQQYFTMLSEGNPPDLTFGNGYNSVYFDFGSDGAYVNLYNYLEEMPNVKAFLEDPKHANDVARYMVAEDEIYCLPIYTESKNDPYTFLYRKDIFEENNLTFPTNQEEFVATLRKLKELYPKSYPFVLRNMNGNAQSIQSFGNLWGASHVNVGIASTIFTLDENGKYYSAQISDSYKEMAQFLQSLTQEGLLHPSSATMDTATWMESFASGTSFVTYDKTDRLPMIAKTGQSLNAAFLMTAAAPFNFGAYAKTAQSVSTSFAPGIGGGTGFWYAIGNNNNKEYSMAYLDWIYSQEGQNLTNWGIEGESYTVDENGNKVFIQSFLKEQGGMQAAGLYQPGLAGVRLKDAYMSSLTESEAQSLELGLQYTEKSAPQHLLHYTEDEQFVYDTYAVALFNYAQSEWLKFFLGQRDFTQWDQVLETMKSKYHYDDVMKIHEDALARVLEEKGS